MADQASPLKYPFQTFIVPLMGMVPLEVTYAGSAPGLITGANQINIRVPINLPFGVSSEAVREIWRIRRAARVY